MIRHIEIRNFATIEDTRFDLHDGLNIITGETGAGKSIVIEAVSLALGSRADSSFVRSGEDKAVIQMVAEKDGQEYIITREISATGRNLCRIGDEIVTLSALSELCRSLADIHGQYDHQSLLDPEYHIDLVDMYHKDKTLPAKDDVAGAYAEYTHVRSRLKELTAQAAKDKRQRDFMEFEAREIAEANLTSGEDEELEQRISVLQNSELIYEGLSGAYEASAGDGASLLEGLKSITSSLSHIGQYSKDLQELAERMNSIYYDLEDASSTIREMRDRITFSPAELDEAIARADMINRLKNKHGMTIDELIAYEQDLDERLARIDNVDSDIDSLKGELHACGERLKYYSAELSKIRREAASELETQITEQLLQLGFKDAVFQVEFKEAPIYTANGNDAVQFLISTNRGEPLKPLSKIASGGEMSRIMLAFKKIIGDYDEIPTMIFDEIDSGISGIAASIVGRKLKEIADNHQIICITHLPQIAACGKWNYCISKHSDDSRTYTEVRALSEEEKIREIARLLGGENITETTLRSAEELIGSSN